MREILFRGKDKYSGKWVEGDLNQLKFYGEILCCNIIPYEDDLHSHEVIPETVGQYTGLTDKNGKKIFEGDIVHCVSRLDNANMIVIFEQGEFRMVLSEKYFEYQTGACYYNIYRFTKEVIGNIHDNPELIEGGEGNG